MSHENIYQFTPTTDSDHPYSFTDDDGNPCITLLAVSQQYPYSIEYLTLCIMQGRLKAFKVGDQWLTTRAWLDEHHHKTKSLIEQKLQQHEYHSGGIRILATAKKSTK